MARNKVSPYRTIFGDKAITYIKTMIVKWDDQHVTLDSGGWRTVTTKRKMCQASRQFDLGYCVYQKDHDWFVRQRDGQTFNFYDGIVVEK